MTDTLPRTRIVSEVDYAKDGKQTGFLRLFHSVHRSAYGFIPIPVVCIRNGDGPTALLMSGNHGDEYEGQVALCNLAKALEPAHIEGRVIILAAANLPASLAGMRTSPLDDGNLNRSFPGDPNGTPTQQMAFYIEHALLPMADVLVDLHSGGSSLMYVPSALGRKADPKARELLRAFGAPVSYVAESGEGGDRTGGGAAMRQGVPWVGTELGGAGHVTRAALAVAERGVRGVLAHMGILKEKPPSPEPTRVLEVAGPDYYVYTAENGVFEPLVELGDTVRAGQPAAKIHFPETPWAPPVTQNFAHDGFVLCKRQPGRTLRGDCLFHLGTDVVDG